MFKYSYLKSNFDYWNIFGMGGYGIGSNSLWSVSVEYGCEFLLDNGNFIEF